MPHQVLPELWPLIIPHLRRPLPPTHTALPTPRSALKQPDLVSALTVCKDWYHIASRALYPVAITNSFPLLLRGVDDPPIPNIPSKRELLGRIKHLYLEPADVLLASADTPVFPNLQTLSVGAFSGSTQFAAQDQRQTDVEWDYIEEAREAASRILVAHPQLRHLCDWGWTNDSDYCPIPPSQTSYAPIRRYIHTPHAPSDSLAHMGSDRTAVERLVWAALMDRQEVVHESDNSDQSNPRCGFDESLYIMIPPDGGQGELSSKKGRIMWRRQAKFMQEVVDNMIAEDAEDLRDWYKPWDSWTVSQLFDAPRCQACGWCPGKAEEGGRVGVELEIEAAKGMSAVRAEPRAAETLPRYIR
ncbi:uncharacterized protein MKK02DRAFT_37859 [Dioszegia hungarica]|uniref:F-box domain-containing protein n=1 Tax=Dioszegia hungarica TaxID=4972 RepID=A0AA38H8Q0_9TREE|nr:uncharacterized protein MKK02DRAFT_37859 [Dioszegia hungarica]KAI9634984.1 hypothetical protein MKK02DRAFT_37859 [Dioszegia hungarica]